MLNTIGRRDFMRSGVAMGAAILPIGRAKAQKLGALASADVIAVREGRIAGTREANGTRVWRGIPFARPPVGQLRGRAPQPAEAWSGMRDATAFGSKAIQQSLDPSTGQMQGSEDCLYLNVWAPERPASAPRPVIVWIHGGGFVFGAGSEEIYRGDGYAERGDVVFVTVNYRLNGFGYLRTSRDPGSANFGLLDQIAALRWVRANIAAFGGDPGNVTVMGESAGGMSIGCLLGAPASRGLFHRAIIQSGGARPVFLPDEPREVMALALGEAGLRPGGDEKLLALPASDLYRIFKALSAASNSALLGGEAFHPAVDGAVLPRHPLLALAPVPTMIGHCENEGVTFAKVTTLIEGLPKKIRSLVGAARWAALTDTYARTPRPRRDPTVDLFSDMFTGIPSLRLADGLVAVGAPVWIYRFDFEKASPIGAAHATDVAFTFGTPKGAPFAVDWDTEAKAVSNRMRDSFVAFARTGSPQTAALPQWPRHDPAGLYYLRFDAKPSVARDIIGEARRSSWKSVPVDAV